MTTAYRRLWQGLLLTVFAVVPTVACEFLVRDPQDRNIHIESFRYGKDPSVICCNRGDSLHLTFSTRDTAHSFFLEEFDIDAKVTPGIKDVLVFRPATDPEALPVETRELVLKAEHPGWRNWLVSKSQFRCHVWCGPMHAFEQGSLIIWPNTLLFAGMGLLAGIAVVGLMSLWPVLRARPGTQARAHAVSPTDGLDIFAHLPWLKTLMKRRGFQFAFVLVAMLVFNVVVFTTLYGVLVSGRNLGMMLLWVVWLFLLTAVLTPWGGRIWCLPCPLPILGEAMQRLALTAVRTGSTCGYNNRFFGLNLRWPGWLSNAWPRMLMFLAMGTFSTLLVANPRVSAWVILGMTAVATAMSLIWELRSFCRYVCPINGFVGLYSAAGKLALRSREPAVCAKCAVRTCQKGSAKGWACPYGLCVAEINENADCGVCTECIKSCAYDNVTLRWRPFAQETAVRTFSEAWLAMAMLVLGIAYCVIHLGPWPAIRDYVDIVDKGNWGLFAIFAAVLWSVVLIALPGLLLVLAAAGKRLAGLQSRTLDLLRSSTGALVPMGLMVWVAFVVPMLMVNVTFVTQSFSDPFGWGWDFFGVASTPWHQLWPCSIPFIQVACILVGVAYSLRNAWRIWLDHAPSPDRALRGVLPLALLLLGISGGLVWFFSN